MKYGFLAFDMGPSKYNRMVADELAKDSSNEIVFVPAQKRGIAAEYGAQIAGCDVVIIGGPASYDTEEETDVLGYVEGGTPIIVLEDTPGSSGRPKFEKFRSRTTAVILAMEQWREQVTSLGYTRSEYFGLPQHWKSTYDSLVAPGGSEIRQEFRKFKVKPRSYLRARSSDLIISFSCVKHARLNNLILSHLQVTALVGSPIVLAIKTRSDEKISDADRAVREALLESPCGGWQLDFGDATLTQILRASNIAVFSGGATDSIAYALARRSAVYCTSKLVRELNVVQGVPDGGEWFVSKLGGNLVVDLDEGPLAFVEAVVSLLTEEGRADLQRKQEIAFPSVPAVWNTASKIAAFLQKVAADSRVWE